MTPHTKATIKKKLLRRLCLTESWVIFFILGIIMMNYPFVIIFNKEQTLFKMPLLFLYFYGGWFISIVVIYIFTKATGFCDRDKKNQGDNR